MSYKWWRNYGGFDMKEDAEDMYDYDFEKGVLLFSPDEAIFPNHFFMADKDDFFDEDTQAEESENIHAVGCALHNTRSRRIANDHRRPKQRKPIKGKTTPNRMSKAEFMDFKGRGRNVDENFKEGDGSHKKYEVYAFMIAGKRGKQDPPPETLLERLNEVYNKRKEEHVAKGSYSPAMSAYYDMCFVYASYWQRPYVAPLIDLEKKPLPYPCDSSGKPLTEHVFEECEVKTAKTADNFDKPDPDMAKFFASLKRRTASKMKRARDDDDKEDKPEGAAGSAKKAKTGKKTVAAKKAKE